MALTVNVIGVGNPPPAEYATVVFTFGTCIIDAKIRLDIVSMQKTSVSLIFLIILFVNNL